MIKELSGIGTESGTRRKIIKSITMNHPQREFYKFYASQNIIRVIKPRKMR
jgi:hypothetical protein